MEEKINVTIRGTSPLLMHRFNDSQDTMKVRKSGRQYNNQEDAENSLYKDEKGKIVHPSVHIESAMIKAATNYRIPGQSKKTYKDAFKGGVFVEPRLIPHKIPKWEIDLQNVVVQRSRVIRARPRFDEWELDLQILNIDERVTSNIIKDILTDAGKFCGIGDFRPRFGRFKVVKFEPVKKPTRDKS
ncbi:MAG: hypothetical protein GTO24_26390 [candidate division Zixibacteria bacterium]|nr:hypothetical protein [candidate division Zixibacteria bacterium]